MIIGGDWHTHSDEAESLCHYFQSQFDRPRFHFPFPPGDPCVYFFGYNQNSESCQGFLGPLLAPKN